VSEEHAEPVGPDFALGFRRSEIPDGGMVAGHAHGKPVLVARRAGEVFAIGGHCTHYAGPLADGLMVGDTVRCPWHHACFSLRTGEALAAPALSPVACWAVEQRDGICYVTHEIDPRETVAGGVDQAAAHRGIATPPASVVVVGGGAAGNAAAEMLRREGYEGPLTMIGGEDTVPYDRPNLSKDYLAGTASEEWIPLRPAAFYQEQGIRLVLGRRVVAVDVPGRRVVLDDASSHEFGALLLAPGAEPVRLPPPVSGSGVVRYLRTLADSRAIIAAAADARRAVVLGASFIGLEVAASLRARGLEVHVVAPDRRPLERVLGRELGDFIRGLHEAHGVVFHLGQSATRIDAGSVTLESGRSIPADLVIAGIGVRPSIELAAGAGLAVDGGIVVDQYLETSEPGIFAAGDVARYPDSRTGARIRVEHWVAAERQGQAAARNILGRREPFATVPFFWSQHYDVAISYVGHAARWDEVEVAGSLERRDCTITYRMEGRTLAVATVGRDRSSLEAELAMEVEARESLAAATAR
jgi:NADPH-dependent 2,4-dienoyl-CoA reductase/sulfur reductase-like enzyme/nitrite reductase/ring-hydroxylating ferredoxin subunit